MFESVIVLHEWVDAPFQLFSLNRECSDNHVGSYVLPGFYSYQAWNEYVQPAIETAAQSPTESKDWYLIHHSLMIWVLVAVLNKLDASWLKCIKKNISAQWRKFLGAIYYAKAGDFNQQTYQIDIL